MLRLAALLVLLALAPAASAGDAHAPEVRDPSGDQALLGVAPLGPGSRTAEDDLLAAWLEETADALEVTIQVAGAAVPAPAATHLYAVHLAVGGTAFRATATLHPAPPTGDGGVTPGGAASAASVEGGLVRLTIPRAALGHPGVGAVASGLVVRSEAIFPFSPVVAVTDRAPDAGSGADFTFAQGPLKPAALLAQPAAVASEHARLAAASAFVGSSTLLVLLATRRRP